MILKFLYISFIISILFVTVSYGNDIFKISPYIIMTDNQVAHLRFRPHQNAKLDIIVKFISDRRITEKVFSKLYLSAKLQSVKLGQIKCGTSLQYDIVHQDSNFTIDRSIHPFSCDPQKSIILGFMSDTQIKNSDGRLRAIKLANTVVELQKKIDFNFIINAGDIVHHGGIEAEWFNFFDISKDYLDRNYLISAIGNHEYYKAEVHDRAADNFMKYMRVPESSNLGNMAINFKHFQILVLNSNFKHLSDTRISYQWNWLRDKLEKAEISNQTSLIVLHHSPFSSSLEHLRKIPKRLRKEFVPLIESFKNVKLVLSGHLHMYERSFKNGIHYVISGPSGGIYNPVTFGNEFMNFRYPFATTFSVIKINQEKISIDSYDTNQTIIDNLIIK